MKTNQGFTLVEVIVSVTLITMGSVALFALVVQIMNFIQPLRENTRSSLIAQTELERIRSFSDEQLHALAPITTVTSSESPSLLDLPNGQAIVYKQPYTNFYSGTEIYAVSVEVSWMQNNGNINTSVLSSLFYQYGVGK